MNNSIRQQERTTPLGSRNETTPLGSRNETTQLVSRNETTQLCTAVDRLQAPTTACNRLHRLYSRIGFFYLLPTRLLYFTTDLHYVSMFTSYYSSVKKEFCGNRLSMVVTMSYGVHIDKKLSIPD
ncbi:hypothetical protein TNCV_1797651 [Trichonephila clavipes]|nr:hypothetical protein TNCV_1797651 [Trichonephila clavipes]